MKWTVHPGRHPRKLTLRVTRGSHTIEIHACRAAVTSAFDFAWPPRPAGCHATPNESPAARRLLARVRRAFEALNTDEDE